MNQIFTTKKMVGHWTKISVIIKSAAVAFIISGAVSNSEASELLRSEFDNFSDSKVSYNDKQDTTYVHSSKNSPLKLMVQISNVLGTHVDVVPPGILAIDISDWKPVKYRECKIIRFHFLKNDDIKKLAEKKINIKVAISADREATGMIMGEGKSKGKHYYFSKPVRIGTEKTVLDISQLLTPEVQALWIRLDLITPTKYKIYSVSIAEDSESEAVAHVTEGVNLLSNGGAEWGFYNTMWNNPVVSEINGKYFVRAKEITGRTTFALDEKIKHSGKRSFRCNGEKNSVGSLSFAPVPYVAGKKVYLTFYAKAAKKGTSVMPTLFLANGQAYGCKSVRLTTEWEKYQYDVIWGQKNGNGVNEIGNVINGYGCQYTATMPRFSTDGLAWIDDVSYSIGKPAADNTALLELNIIGKIDRGDGLYKTGEAVKADLVFESASDTMKKYDLTAELIDFKGDGEGVVKLSTTELSPGEKRNYSVKITPRKRGSFILNIKAVDINTRKSYDYNLIGGVVPAQDKKIKRIAVDLTPGRNLSLSLPYLKQFGIGSVRIWSAYRWWFGEYIGLRDIPAVKSEGMWILLNVGFPDQYLRVPKDLNATIERWRKDIGPYADKVDSFEILNEPNIWTNNGKADPAYENMSSTAYVRTLAAAYKLFKELNPKAIIAGPTTCHTDVSFTSGILAAGGGQYLEAITEHPYRNQPELPDFDTDLSALRKIAGNKPIYSTECGRRFPAIIRNNILNDTYREKLAEIMRLHLIAYGCGNEIYVNFAWEVDPMGMSWQLFMGGSPDNNGMPRPAPVLYATRAMADILGNASTMGRIKLGSQYRSYLFDKGDQRVAAIWKFDGPGTVVDLSKVPGKSELLDMMGNQIELSKSPLNQFPVYLLTDADSETIRKYFSRLDLNNMGQTVSASIRVTGMKQIGINVTNMRNKSIKGSVKMGDETKPFELNAETNKLITFDSTRPISTIPQLFSAEVTTENPQSAKTIKKELKALFAEYTAKDLNIDGDLSDWPAQQATALNYKNAVTYIDWNGNEKKITADIRTAWNQDYLYIAVTVHKNGFYPSNRQEVWEGDGLQIAFDTICNGKKGAGYGDDDFEYGVALQSGKAEVYRSHASSASHDSLPKKIGKLEGSEVKAFIKTYPDRQVYEMAFGRCSVSPFRLEAGNIMNWDLIVNLSNGKKRIGYLEITPGIGKDKDPYMFIPLLLKK